MPVMTKTRPYNTAHVHQNLCAPRHKSGHSVPQSSTEAHGAHSIEHTPYSFILYLPYCCIITTAAGLNQQTITTARGRGTMHSKQQPP
eukprot:1157328-Pelagomonas_calceolata.AAC.19